MSNKYSVELCRAVNEHVTRRTKDALIANGISFSEEWRYVPIWKRAQHNGASKVCIFFINRNEYSKARRSLECLDKIYKTRIELNYI